MRGAHWPLQLSVYNVHKSFQLTEAGAKREQTHPRKVREVFLAEKHWVKIYILMFDHVLFLALTLPKWS